MEEIDDNDFSDLYADVEAQANSAITALHRLTQMPPEGDKISDSSTEGDERECRGFTRAEISKAGFHNHVAAGEDNGGGLTKIPMDGGNRSNTDSGNGNEKRVYDEDYTSKRKQNSNCDSTKRSYRGYKNVDSDDDNGIDLYSIRANEDTRPISGCNGGGEIAHERQPDVYGSMHTFDWREDIRHEVSECDSDGTLGNPKSPGNKYRKNTTNTSSGVPSAVSSESSQSRRSGHRGRRLSCSPSPTRPRIFSSSSVRDSGRIRKDTCQRMKSSVTPDWKGHLTNKNGSYVSDIRRPYDRHTRHGKDRTLRNFDYNDKDMSYCTSDSRNTLKQSRETNYEAFEDDWNLNRRRVITAKYPPAVGTRGGTRFFNRRCMRSGETHREQLDRNITRDRREMDISEQGKRWRDHTLGISHKLQYIEERGSPERNMRCTWKEMGIGSNQYGNVRRNMTGHHDWGNTLGMSHKLRYIETGGTPERNMRCTWKEVGRGNGQYGNVRNMTGQYDWGDRIARRHHQSYNVLLSRDQLYKDRHEGDYLERISRSNMRRAAELIDEREVDRHRFKMQRDEHRHQFDGCRKFIQRRSCMDVPQRYRDSVEPPMDIEGKKIKAEAEDDKYHNNHDLSECNGNQKHRNSKEDSYKDVLVNESKVDEFLDIEEGEIVTEEVGDDTGYEVGKALNDDKIREIMEKMERRRERFKVPPIDSNRESEKLSNRLLDFDVESNEEGKIERPARKRKWF